MSDTNCLHEQLERLEAAALKVHDASVDLKAPGFYRAVSDLMIEAQKHVRFAREALSVPEEAGPERIGGRTQEGWRAWWYSREDHLAELRAPSLHDFDALGAAAFRSPVPGPARMSREEMVALVAKSLEAAVEIEGFWNDVSFDSYPRLATAVLTALGFPGEEKEKVGHEFDDGGLGYAFCMRTCGRPRSAHADLPGEEKEG